MLACISGSSGNWFVHTLGLNARDFLDGAKQPGGFLGELALFWRSAQPGSLPADNSPAGEAFLLTGTVSLRRKQADCSAPSTSLGTENRQLIWQEAEAFTAS